MYKKVFIYLLFFLMISTSFSQQIEGKVLDFMSKNPIENAAIQTIKNTGTTSNKEGIFLLNISKIDSLTISSLGFIPKTISVSELIQNNYVVFLKETSFELDEFELNTTKLSLSDILRRTSENMKKNRFNADVKKRFYARENTKVKFENVEIELKRSTLLSRKNKKLAEQELAVFSNKIKNSNPDVSSEYYGNLLYKKVYSKKAKKYFTTKNIDSLQGFKTIDDTKDFTVNSISEKMQELVLKYLNKEKTYKIKTGLFKIEDSISLKKIVNSYDSLDTKNTFNRFEPLSITQEIARKERMFTKENEKNFLNSKYFDHSLLHNEYFKGQNNFVVVFYPRKSKAKFTGKLFINTDNFTITKITYSYADGKRGQHLNFKLLLGVKFSENRKTGVIHFNTFENGNYYINYYKESVGMYTYANRPFKFIENSKDKNKVKFNLKFELSTLETKEFLLSDEKLAVSEQLEKINIKEKNKRIPYVSKETYQNSIWKNRQLVNDYLNTVEHQN